MKYVYFVSYKEVNHGKVVGVGRCEATSRNEITSFSQIEEIEEGIAKRRNIVLDILIDNFILLRKEE